MKNEIGLVVLNYNTAEQTIRNVNIAKKNNRDIFVVIVDNCSPQNDYLNLTNIYKNEDQVDVILSPENGGYSKGNNLGVRFLLKKYPGLRYIAIMNPDVRCDEPELFRKLVAALETTPDMALIAPLMIEENKINFDKIGWNLPSYRELFLKRAYICGRIANGTHNKYIEIFDKQILKYDTVQGSFFIVKRKEFCDINFFDENLFMYAEENVLAARLKEKNVNSYAGVLLGCTYVHEHKYARRSLNVRKRIIKKQFLSEAYYINKYSDFGYVQKGLLKLLEILYLNIELPIGEFLHRLINN